MRQLGIHTAPQLEDYSSQHMYHEGQTAEVWLEGQVFTVAVRDLLP